MKLKISFYNMQDLVDILLREGYEVKISEQGITENMIDNVIVEILDKIEENENGNEKK